jgi:light-regulated signal transduction histidine kinase (bacteriophytochrome)
VTNSAFQRNFNWNNIDLLGKPFFELNDQGWDVPRLRVLFEKLLPESSYVKNFELEFDCPSKGKLILNLNAKQLLEHGKKQQKILIFITDITSQKKDSENLSFENKELNSINKDLDTFVYTASHDLKAPVNNLKGLIKALKEEEDTKARNELMDMVDISLEKLNSAISDLAKTGRAKKSQGEASSLIYFEKIVEDVKEFLKNEIQESNAIIIEDFTYAPTLFFSRKNLRSLFQNLISNAIKYRYSDRNTEIQISSAQQEEYILLQITDNSIEIKEEDKAKVFEMDQRLHTHVEDKEVGLGIVARIINNSGGKIEIDSEQGKGNTFKIYFKV